MKPPTDQEMVDYLANRDPVLGWPTMSQLASSMHDESGARPNPSIPYPAEPCVAAFGDSFIYSTEATDEQAWSNRLSELLDCRVANFGVGGYGTDQAYLRMQKLGFGPARVVFIGFFPSNIARNVNRARGWLRATGGLLPKPRFLATEEGVALARLPGATVFRIYLLHRLQGRFR
jgi:hypothetical protein